MEDSLVLSNLVRWIVPARAVHGEFQLTGGGSACPLSRREGYAAPRQADQFRNVQARSRGGGEASLTAVSRTAEAKRAGPASTVSGAERVDSPERESRNSGVASPGGSAAREQQVAVRDGAAGAGDRPSPGHTGQAGGGLWGQQPAGIAAAGAGQIASTGDVATRGSIPATSASATSRRADIACRSRIERILSKIRASYGDLVRGPGAEEDHVRVRIVGGERERGREPNVSIRDLRRHRRGF
jgi:hypothetical protein